ncbi:lipoyl protein ligase domain-containing protein [Pseudomonas sp. zfem005]|uniref:lipoate--protein ligase family protein n=1 Tax=Pseudomonas sp. zfem005 TaxID=3078200 RepID=UPI00292830A7|nr:lipoate--protein ligase family protein [Pseudomonas sp. zfem005]MDU9414792.1 lipoate--protein ligase family protein [Pseudomonas sp. zfem005]
MQRHTVGAGLDAERQLLDQVYDGQRDSGLLLWRPLHAALVMPRRMSRLPAYESARQACLEQGWPIALRDTGGEPVPQSSAVLNVALAYAVPREENELTRIETAYRRLCQPLCDWLSGLDLEPGLGEVEGAFCDGRFNVNLQGRKLVGTAQRWRRRQRDGRHVVLAHGAILMGNQREAMVEVVNTFYRECGLDTRCRAGSHIALEECRADAWDASGQLAGYYQRMLEAAGIDTDL